MKSDHTTTRSPRLSLWLTSLTAAGLLPLGATGLSAQTTDTWNGGTGNWNDNTFWSTGTVPNGAAYDVYIDGGKTTTASVVTVNGGYTVGRLTVDAGDTVNFADGATLSVNAGAFSGSGSLVNNGTLNLNSSGGGVILQFNGAGSITGTGTVNLSGTFNNIQAGNSGDRITIGAGQIIAGQANLGNNTATFTNNGVVTANQNGNTLRLQPGGGTADFTNAGSGVARAENGGVLELYSGTFTGNSFTALTGSRVQVDNGATVSGATLASSGTGVVTLTNGTLTNVTNSGTLNVQDSSPTVNGTLTNNGTLNLNSSGGGNILKLGGPVTLAGTGTVNFSGTFNNIQANNAGDRLTIGAGQTIAGQVNLGNGTATFTNNGTVNANLNGATLLLQPGGGTADFTNTASGVLEASNGGTLALSGASGGVFKLAGTVQALNGSTVQIANEATISGTTFTTAGTGVVTLGTATLTNVTNNGTLNVLDGSGPQVSGTLINNGTLNLNSSGNGVNLAFNGAGSITGTGTLNLSGTFINIQALNTGDRITIGAGQTVAGQGNLGNGGTTFTNNGFVTANQNGNTLLLQPGGGTADFTNNGYLIARNGGTLAFNNTSGGTLTNHGNLEVLDGSTLTVPAGALTNLSGTTLTGGDYVVSAASASSPATLSLGGGSIVTNNAFVELSGPGAVFNEIKTLANNASGGGFTVESGAQFTTAGALTNAGTLSAAAGTITVAGTLTNSGQALTYNGGSVAVQGNTTNSGTIRTESGTFMVQGTLNNSGTLQTSFFSTAGSITATGALTQTAAGILLGSGTVTAPSLALAGSLRPGDIAGDGGISSAVGTLTLNGQVGLVSDTTLVFDLAGTAASDEIKVGGALTLDGTLNVNALAGFGAGRYDLIDYTGTLTNNTLNLGTLPNGYNYQIDTSIAGQVDLVVTSAVPEPSTWLGGLLSLGLLAFLRRRSRA